MNGLKFKHKIRKISISYLYLFLLLLACTLPQAAGPAVPDQTTQPSPSAATPSLETVPLTPADPVELPPAAPWDTWLPPDWRDPVVDSRIIFSPTLELIANPAALPALSDEERRRLLEAGLVTLDDRPDDPAVLLDRQIRSGQPLWIGADHVIWRTQTIQNQVLRQVDSQVIAPLLGRWLTGLAQASAGQIEGASAGEDPLMAAAARRNLAYVTLAANLLDPAFPVDPMVTELVRSELDLISVGGAFQSPYSGQMTDYQPWQDHSNNLDRARLWLAAVPLVNTANPAVEASLAGRQLQLMLQALSQDGETADLWRRLYRLHGYLEGGSAEETLWRQLQRVSPAAAAPEELAAAVRAAGSTPFHLLPPPQSWQAIIFDELTFNQVGVYSGEPGSPPFTAVETAVGVVRLLPHPLDIAAVQSSTPALEWLTTRNHTAFERYFDQLGQLREQLAGAPTGWEQVRWQAALPLLDGPELTSRHIQLWEQAVLNHPDGWGAVALPPDVVLYLESEPALYARLSTSTNHLRQTLTLFEGLDAESAARLDNLTIELAVLAQISLDELAGRPLTTEQGAALAGWVGAPPAGSLPRPVSYYPPVPEAGLQIEAAVPLLAVVAIDGEQTVAVNWTFLISPLP